MSDSDGATPRVHQIVVTVRSYELDSFGHANHAVFLNYLEYGRFEALRAVGLPYRSIVARGWGVFVVRVEIDYLAEARLDDRLVVRTWPRAYRRSSLALEQEILREDDPRVVVARAVVTTVWVGADRKPMRVPDEVRASLGEGGVGGPGSP